MKIQNQDRDRDVDNGGEWKGQDEPAASTFLPSQPAKRGSRWLPWLSSVVVLVLIGLSAGAFMFFNQRQQQGQGSSSVSTWRQVLNNYQVSELVSAPSRPDTLYACALPSLTNNPGSGVTGSQNQQAFSLLVSTDAGLHWQAQGKQAALGGSCELAVSSTNPDELYVLSSPASSLPGETTPSLKHSLNGGRSWQTLSPKLQGAATHSWSVTQITLAGNELFGLQVMQVPAQLPGGLIRLVRSTDGGQTWSAVDNQLARQGLSARQYRIDPAHPETLYVLEGGSALPGLQLPGGNQPVPHGPELYKSTDGGSTWSSVLKNLSYGTQLQLAAGRSGLLYLGETFGPVPLAGSRGSDNYSLPPNNIKGRMSVNASFRLRMSSNGGKDWKDITPANQLTFSSSWVVANDGRVYFYSQSAELPTVPGNGTPHSVPGSSGSVTGTGQAGTGQPIGSPTLNKPGVTPQIRNGVPYIPAQGTPAGPILNQPSHSSSSSDNQSQQTVTPGSGSSIHVYDPVTGSWQVLATVPGTQNGRLLAATPAGQQGQYLWLLGTSSQGDVLYRGALN